MGGGRRREVSGFNPGDQTAIKHCVQPFTSNCEHVVPEFSHYAEIWPWCYVTKLRKNCFFTIMSAGDGNCVGVGHEVEGLHTIDV